MSEPSQAPRPSIQRITLILLVLGVMVRCVALFRPLIDAHLLRQCQTALATEAVLEHGGLTSVPAWLGDSRLPYIQELPIYNYLVAGLSLLTGQLDVSGKLVSIALWAVSFLLLQRLWSRFLNPERRFWANLLFVFAPLGVFFGQAFMPEMLIQVLGLGFLLAMVRYSEERTLRRWTACWAVGLLGMMTKTPEMLHLYLVLFGVVLVKEGWRGLFRPRYLVAGIVSLVALKLWGNYVTQVNHAGLPEWEPSRVFKAFVGTAQDRIALKGYAKLAAYYVLFIWTAVGLPVALLGICRIRRAGLPAWVHLWFGSILFFYLFWAGPVGMEQSYYNLPALAPAALLFALGMEVLSACFRQSWTLRGVQGIVAAAFLAFSLASCAYLFRPDWTIYRSAIWVREHAPTGSLILLKTNHRDDMIDYPHQTAFPYYSGHPVWVWGKLIFTPEYRQRALETSQWAVVTRNPHPAPRSPWLTKILGPVRQPEDMAWLSEKEGFKQVYEAPDFLIYARNAETFPVRP